MRNISTRIKLELVARSALAKKAGDVVLLDLRKLSSICDYFIIASGDSITQVGAIADNIEKELAGHNCRPWHVEGRREALWILLDYGEAVVHIFHKDTRGFYNLEKLWHDAPQKKLKEAALRKKRRRPSKKKTKRS